MSKELVKFIIIVACIFAVGMESIQEHTEMQKQLFKIEAKQDSILLKLKR